LAIERITGVIELPAAMTCQLTVAAVIDLGPRMRRITLAGDPLADFVALPGQDVVLHLSDGEGGGLSRRYTIRHLDNQSRRVDLDFVRHGHGPGALWAESVQVGDPVEIFGPRGKTPLTAAGWQLFAGDESAIPAIAEMVSALPSGAQAVALIEVQDAADEQLVESAAAVDLRWLHRLTTAPGDADLLDTALQAVPIPDADRHAYLFGESRVVRRLRGQLHGRGLQPAEVSAKGYWNLGRAMRD
jgi:NADPH-dependent ferric siderophore reductase